MICCLSLFPLHRRRLISSHLMVISPSRCTTTTTTTTKSLRPPGTLLLVFSCSFGVLARYTYLLWFRFRLILLLAVVRFTSPHSLARFTSLVFWGFLPLGTFTLFSLLILLLILYSLLVAYWYFILRFAWALACLFFSSLLHFCIYVLLLYARSRFMHMRPLLPLPHTHFFALALFALHIFCAILTRHKLFWLAYG